MRKIEWLVCEEEWKVERTFPLCYQRAVLLALERRGVFDQHQLSVCLQRLGAVHGSGSV
jgi:hypothetical protein